jgi:dihydropteroate synthase
MGILNVTPDSFSDGGLHLDPGNAVRQGLAMVVAGADIVDIGGESTRPGAVAPGTAVELSRVIPVIRALRASSDVLISVDTSDPEVMAAAVAAGADMLNDIRALTRPGALDVAVRSGLPVCLMHMQGSPESMQVAPHYGDVVSDVAGWLSGRVAECVAAGLPRESLILDPGFGFGKTLEHNRDLLCRLDELVATGLPVLVGLSRKSMISQLLDEQGGAAPSGRLGGSLALALKAREKGAKIVRVHDVEPTVQAFRVTDGLGCNS